ncbi:hypothetical protein CVT24_001464 [Panaeolus cyanescens]|uniref:Uncharacterized protein n=1 Tax=Panaeolus cyanescens TaxID=181874 RepID=A0A409VT97_9AGAR|nr:hypothetical protein CVT24_001464 [Panaeolus cyanescens]
MAADPLLLESELKYRLHKIIAPFLTACLADTLLYGIHVVLFISCVRILWRNSRSAKLFILLPATMMFIISTIDAGLSFSFVHHELAEYWTDYSMELTQHGSWKSVLFVANNFFAEVILLYRCYVVWSRSLYLLLAFTAMGIVNTGSVFCDTLLTHFLIDHARHLTVCGFIGTGRAFNEPGNDLVKLYNWFIFAFNVLLTALTVGRILWVSKMAGSQIEARQVQGFRMAAAIIIESSAVYSAVILVYILFPPIPWKILSVAILMRTVAIMPALLIVQVGMNRGNVSNRPHLTTTDSDFHHRTSVVLDTVLTSGLETTLSVGHRSTTLSAMAQVQSKSHLASHLDLNFADRNITLCTIADIFLIIRCYVVWGRRRIVLYLSGLILAAGTALGIYSECTKSLEAKKLIIYYISIILFLNAALTILTAGRILWVARQIKRAMGPNFVSQYYFAVAVVVESGFLYTGASVLLIILSPTRFVLLGAVIAIRAVCIMPILLIVQVATGRSIEELRMYTMTRPTRMRQRETVDSVVLDTVISEVVVEDVDASFYRDMGYDSENQGPSSSYVPGTPDPPERSSHRVNY